MGIKFNNLCEIVLEKNLSNYLENLGFELSKLEPYYLTESGYREQVSINVPCLKLTIGLPDDDTLRIFVNSKDIYYEVYDFLDAYKCSGYYKSSDYNTVEKLDELLDIIYDRII